MAGGGRGEEGVRLSRGGQLLDLEGERRNYDRSESTRMYISWNEGLGWEELRFRLLGGYLRVQVMRLN
jgi:hypothetical protein